MNPASPPAARRRAIALWLTVTAGAAALGLTAGPAAAGLAGAPGRTFAELLVQACSVAALAAAALLWLATTDVVGEVLRSPVSVRRRVGPLRTALLAVCGVAVLSATASAATAQEGPDAPLAAETLDGLPLPDRAVGAPTRDDVVRVRAGDSLWSIADRVVGAGAPAADVASYVQRIHALNVAAIGPDPDLIRPGQHLQLPPR